MRNIDNIEHSLSASQLDGASISGTKVFIIIIIVIIIIIIIIIIAVLGSKKTLKNIKFSRNRVEINKYLTTYSPEI